MIDEVGLLVHLLNYVIVLQCILIGIDLLKLLIINILWPPVAPGNIVNGLRY